MDSRALARVVPIRQLSNPSGYSRGCFPLVGPGLDLLRILAPPVFSKHNFKRFMGQLYHVMLRGSERELAVISDEFGRSADALVAATKTYPRFAALRELVTVKKRRASPGVKITRTTFFYLLGNRKFCRQMAISAPVSAIEIF